MDFQQLNIFISVATLKSFSRAAETLFISQPAVSVRIKGLEEELGVVLFDRSRSRELSLTEAGRKFLDHAQQMVNQKEEALAQLARGDGAPAGPVQLGASTVPGNYLLPSILAQFKKRHPGITISLSIMDSARVLEKLFDYNIDLGFVGSRVHDLRLRYYPFAGDELILITPAGYFDPAPVSSQPEELAVIPLERCLGSNLIVREKGSATRDLFEAALAKEGLCLHDFASLTLVDSVEAIKQSVRAGLGLSLVSRYSAADFFKMSFVDGYRLMGLNLAREIYLVRHTGRVLSRAAKLALALFSGDIAG